MRRLFDVFQIKHALEKAQNVIKQRQNVSSQAVINNMDFVIAVIGSDGSGKSSVIGAMTGNGDAIRDELSVSDSGIRIVVFEGLERSNQRIVFIDTPGIDHKSKSEEELLKKIGDCLPKTCTLAAIFYLHKITENRVPVKYLTNIHRYRTLCGTDDLRKVHLVTTLWNEVDENDGLKVESELKEGRWRATIDQNARTHRYLCTAASAWSIVEGCIKTSNLQFDNKVSYDLADLEGKIKEIRANGSRQDFEQLKALYLRRKTILEHIRAAVMRGEAGDQWVSLRSEFDTLHIQLCEVGDRLKKVPKLASSFGTHLNRITSGSSAWGAV